jgi:hypothetical protein
VSRRSFENPDPCKLTPCELAARDPRFSVPKSKGREVMVYLKFIIDYYDRLSSTIALIHPHEKFWPVAWHTDAKDYKNTIS